MCDTARGKVVVIIDVIFSVMRVCAALLLPADVMQQPQMRGSSRSSEGKR